MIRWAIVLTLILAALPLYADDSAGQLDEFEMANRFYEKKDYASAIRMYESVLEQGKESAVLYFNLGNAYFKSGELGFAVLNYMKARRLDPGDDDIRHNLEFARRFSQVQMEGVQLNPINSFVLSIVEPYSFNTVAWVWSIVFVLLIVMLIVRFGMALTGPAVRAGMVVVVTLLVVSSSLAVFKYRHDYLTRWAVIVAEDSPVLTGPTEQSDVLLEGAPGLVVEIIEQSGPYYNVLFENKRRGWMKMDLVAEI
jgi:tetratricopeptide (TPR) repeat protein